MQKIRGNTQIMDGTIYDAQLAAAAGIATSKLADGASFFKRDGSIAATGAFNLGSYKIGSLADPTLGTDAATKQYVDNLVGNGIAVKTAVKFTTTANVALTGLGTQAGGDWSASLTAGDRILVKDNTTGSENGIYTAAASGWTRATDFDTAAEMVPNSFFFVSQGSTLADTGWTLTTDGVIAVGTTSLAFNQFSSAGVIIAGNGLDKTGSTLDVRLGNGVEFISNNITVKLADSTLSLSAAGVKLAALASTNILVGNGSNVATAVAISGDATLSDTGVLTLASTVAKHADFVFNEQPSGTINGTNTVFTLASTPRAGTVSLFQNGIRLFVGAGNDYTISGQTITFVTAPVTGDNMIADYNK
jgi:hypothetical protein